MKTEQSIACPGCGGTHLTIKRAATYLYSYNLATPETEKWTEHEEGLPFLFDSRELLDSNEYLECTECGAKYPCDIDRQSGNIDFTVLRKAIRADRQTNPEFLG